MKNVLRFPRRVSLGFLGLALLMTVSFGCSDRFSIEVPGDPASGGAVGEPDPRGVDCCELEGIEGTGGAGSWEDGFEELVESQCNGVWEACVVDWVGRHDEPGFSMGSEPRFGGLSGVAESEGLLYVTHAHALSVIDPVARTARLVAGSDSSGNSVGTGQEAEFFEPRGVVVHDGVAYVADTGNRRIVAVDLESGRTTPYISTLVSAPSGLAVFVDPVEGPQLLIADEALHIVSRVRLDATAPTPGVIAGTHGTPGSNPVSLNRPFGLLLLGHVLFVSERGNHWVRSIDLSKPAPVSLQLEWEGESPGYDEGSGTAARLREPTGLFGDERGIFVVDAGNHVIRYGTRGGALKTLAGRVGEAGHRSGRSDQVRLDVPLFGVAIGDSAYLAEDAVLRRLGLP